MNNIRLSNKLNHIAFTLFAMLFLFFNTNAQAYPILVNEINAIDDNQYNLDNYSNLDFKPKGNGFDTYFGRVYLNGGGWIELVVVNDHLDIRGWQVVVTGGFIGELIVTIPNWDVLKDLKSGTILTLSAIVPDDRSYDTRNNDWWVNINVPNLKTNNHRTNVQVLDAENNEVLPLTGEYASNSVGIDGYEVFKLKADPSANINSTDPNYGDDNNGKVLSTFGQPNSWIENDLIRSQDFSFLRNNNKIISTSAFIGSHEDNTSGDVEGAAYVPNNNALWIADDSSSVGIYSVDKDTGALITKIPVSEFLAFTGDSKNSQDIEALAYDDTSDILYVFSGSCCTNSPGISTVFKLNRQSSDGLFSIESYNALGVGNEHTGAGFYNGSLYVTQNKMVVAYDYVSNATQLNNIIYDATNDPWDLYGLTFTTDTLWMVTGRTGRSLIKYNLTSGQETTFDLGTFGICDPRAVEIINNEIYIVDGFDGKYSPTVTIPAGCPEQPNPIHAVHVFTIENSSLKYVSW